MGGGGGGDILNNENIWIDPRQNDHTLNSCASKLTHHCRLRRLRLSLMSESGP